MLKQVSGLGCLVWRALLFGVGYGDGIPKKSGFSMENICGPSFGRVSMAKASKSALRPAFGQPEADLEALPFKIQAKTLPTSVFHKNNLLS